MFPRMVTKVPEDRSGNWRVEHFRVSKAEADWSNRMAAFHPGARDEHIDPGRYARLMCGGEVVMSDTPFERLTNTEVVMRAHGDVLIAGLGLGMVVHGIGKYNRQNDDPEAPGVNSITVIEKSAHVLGMIGPTVNRIKFPGGPVKLIHEDIFEYKPEKGRKFNTIYFDIWADQSTDALKDMAKLHRRFGRYLDQSDRLKWIESWRRDWLRYMKSRGI